MTAQIIGITLGLIVAISQSLSYIFSRLFVIRRQQATVRLLVAAHLWMALFSLVILPFAWSPGLPPFRSYALLVVLTNLPYLLAQAGLFIMLRRAQASSIVPLLALKIVVLAIMTRVFLGHLLSTRQWSAVAVCVVGALLLNVSRGRLPYKALPWLLCALLGYSLSDFNIKQLVHVLGDVGLIRASIIGTAMSYIFCGLAVLPLIPWAGGRRVMKDWTYALPFAFFWYFAIACLFACFAYVGPVFGNIMQSLRGIITILLGALLARHGFSELGDQLPGHVLLRRICATALMIAAIWLFATG